MRRHSPDSANGDSDNWTAEGASSVGTMVALDSPIPPSEIEQVFDLPVASSDNDNNTISAQGMNSTVAFDGSIGNPASFGGEPTGNDNRDSRLTNTASLNQPATRGEGQTPIETTFANTASSANSQIVPTHWGPSQNRAGVQGAAALSHGSGADVARDADSNTHLSASGDQSWFLSTNATTGSLNMSDATGPLWCQPVVTSGDDGNQGRHDSHRYSLSYRPSQPPDLSISATLQAQRQGAQQQFLLLQQQQQQQQLHQLQLQAQRVSTGLHSDRSPGQLRDRSTVRGHADALVPNQIDQRGQEHGHLALPFTMAPSRDAASTAASMTSTVGTATASDDETKRRHVLNSFYGDKLVFQCQARGVPDHDDAQIIVSRDILHGMIVQCNKEPCRAIGRRFRWCQKCGQPVAKGNFSKRHYHDGIPVHHGLYSPSKPSPSSSPKSPPSSPS